MPKGQWPVSMYTKLKVTFSEDTIVSAMERLTANEGEEERVEFKLTVRGEMTRLCILCYEFGEICVYK